MDQARGGRSESTDTSARAQQEQQEEGQARQQSKEVARQTQEQASYYAVELRQRVEDQIDTRKEWASGELSGISKALRQTGGQLREQDQDSIGQYAEQAAGQTDRLSGYLHDKEASQLIGDVESFARSRPSVFLGGAVVLGAAAARFLKSSSGGNGGSGHGGYRTDSRDSSGEGRPSRAASSGTASSGTASSGTASSGTGGGMSR